MGKDDGKLTLTVNRHTLTGIKRRGRWRFRCKSWPEMCPLWNGSETLSGAVGDFMGRVLAAGAVTVRRSDRD